MKYLHLIIYIGCLNMAFGTFESAYAQSYSQQQEEVRTFSQKSSFMLTAFNCENAFDLQHDEGKDDYEYTEGGARNWTGGRFYRKMDGIAKVIAAADPIKPVGMVALCEVENDSVLEYLTRRSVLKAMDYDYVMTNSSDKRGVDVAVLYSNFAFRLINHESVRPNHVGTATRDILHLWGTIADGDTLDVYALHLPSKLGGKEAEKKSLQVAEQVAQNIDSVKRCRPNTRIVVLGDFNSDYNSSLFKSTFHAELYWSCDKKLPSGLYDVIMEKVPKGLGTYKYRGNWSVIDHILVSGNVDVLDAGVLNLPFLLEGDLKYGGMKPRRTYVGYKYNGGISDHLPIWIRIR